MRKLIAVLALGASLLSQAACTTREYVPVSADTSQDSATRADLRKGVRLLNDAGSPSLARSDYLDCFLKDFDVDAEFENSERGVGGSGGQRCPGNQTRRGGVNIYAPPSPTLDAEEEPAPTS